MHYSPQSLQLGAEVQAKIDIDAGGRRFGFQYGEPPPRRDDETVKYVAGAAAVLGVLWWLSR